MSAPVEELKSIVGASGWSTDPDELEPHLTEWRGTWRGNTPILLQPATTDEVAEIVRACGRSGTAIVPQGGNTGLCGGAVPDSSGEQVVLSLSRLDRIRGIDAADYSITAEAGCVLADLQAAARQADRLFALSLAAAGRCQIGGNLSTNAGGTNVLRYGTARDQVLGLEVVLPDGRIWNGLRRLRKDTAGYDLKQLFVGAEGTLGVITAACLRLQPLPDRREVMLIALDDAESAVALFAECRHRLADQMQAFELIPAIALEFVGRHLPDVRIPMPADHPWYVLLDTAVGVGSAAIEQQLQPLIEDGLIKDAVLAKNATEQEQIWRLRHSISEAQKLEGASLKHDVSVPVGKVAEFIRAGTSAVVDAFPGARVVAFGHVGDGNVHFNVSRPVDAADAAFLARREGIADVVYSIVDRFGGSISAEHGVGVLKRDRLRRHRGDVEVDLMLAIKRALDPQGIMNPGKVLSSR
ncbi:MAG: FAD-binding oxidoreductase [Woeseiaceae bacterium]|nr:FAD-binding oxidoreductase [Woeseiaceae bacterium]